MLPCTILVLLVVLVSLNHGYAQKNADINEQQVLDELMNAFQGEEGVAEHFSGMVSRSSIRLDSLQSSAPTFATTSSPSFAPSFHHTSSPTFAPSLQTQTPSEAPTAAPSIAPTYAPSVAPSVRPTIAPTLSPSAAPTITRSPTNAPTQASPLILSFNSYYTMNNVTTTDLSTSDQQAAINAQANVTQISASYITYVKAYFSTSRRRLSMSLEAASPVVVVTLATIPMADFPSYTPNDLYNSLTAASNAAVSDGTYTKVLQTQAVSLGATALTTASSNHVTYSPPVIKSTDESDDDDDDELSGGAIAGIVIGVVVFVALLIFGGYYYYVNYYVNAHSAVPPTKAFENEL
eukprot:scaffold1493_cov172-Ochromonas_danica.AAC.7